MSGTKKDQIILETQIKFRQLKQQSEEEELPRKPSNFVTVCGILLSLVIFCFTFTVIGMYMMCRLPSQRGKLCYFEQYRTILEDDPKIEPSSVKLEVL